ncbi:hypothetical protein [Novipirellula artificiosorum]|uniref:AsmA-like C-terminal domain-containing protein n=1 Tax=Novipirellula artificiosorum TaxID=2528016 RepID=A0A5C6E0P1_9BACT|nr:hypothetical protein [Novipirellula artificiosorum]TWU42452.1 hypothetical protein Poly41_07490 [Novipirellula artificiosorum]
MHKDVTVAATRLCTLRSPGGRVKLTCIVGAMACVVMVLIATVIVLTPAVISRSSLGRSLLSRAIAGHGFSLDAKYMRIGWFTPLRLTGVEIHGTSNKNHYLIGQIDSEVTLAQLLGLRNHSLGQVVIHSVDVSCSIRDGRCSLEEDFPTLLAPAGAHQRKPIGRVQIQRLRFSMADHESGKQWRATMSRADILLSHEDIAATFSGSLDRSVASNNRESGATNKRVAVIDGKLTITKDRIMGHHVIAKTDFAQATINASVARSISLSDFWKDPLQSMGSFDGNASATVDLERLHAAMPGLLPLRDDVEIVSSQVVAKLESIGTEALRKTRISLQTSPLHATAIQHGDRCDVSIDPIDLLLVIAHQRDQWRAEEFHLTSEVASITGQGNSHQGTTEFEIDVARLTSTVAPILEMVDPALEGLIQARFDWDQVVKDQWRVEGSATASDLLRPSHKGEDEQPRQIALELDVCGRWDGKVVREISEATFAFCEDKTTLHAELLKPVPFPKRTTPFPLRLAASGQVERLFEQWKGLLPSQMSDAKGDFAAELEGDFSYQSARLSKAKIEFVQPSLAYANRSFSQPRANIEFAGDWTWPTGALDAERLAIDSPALTASLQGKANPNDIDLQLEWQANLNALQKPPLNLPLNKTIATPIHSAQRLVTSSIMDGSCEPSPRYQRRLEGRFCGSGTIVGNEQWIDLNLTTIGRDIAFVEKWSVEKPAPLANTSIDGSRTLRVIARAASPDEPHRIVWAEPVMQIDAQVQYDKCHQQIVANEVQIAGQWFSTVLSGKAVVGDKEQSGSLSGLLRMDMQRVGVRLTKVSETPIKMEGVHEAPLTLQWRSPNLGAVRFDVETQLGWDQASFAGIDIGPTSFPVQWNETTAKVDKVVMPIGDCRIQLGGEVDYRYSPRIVRLKPGMVTDSIKLTRPMTAGWFRFIAPTTSEVRSVDGHFGLEIDEGNINLDAPERSRVVGRVNVHHAQMSLNPMAKQIIAVAKGVQSLSRKQPFSLKGLRNTQVTMPPQTVEFDLDYGTVHNQGMTIEFDQTQVITRGGIRLDGHLNMIAKVPREAVQLGRIGSGEDSKFVYLPISGTVDRPIIDPTGISNIASLLSNPVLFGSSMSRSGDFQTETK